MAVEAKKALRENGQLARQMQQTPRCARTEFFGWQVFRVSTRAVALFLAVLAFFSFFVYVAAHEHGHGRGVSRMLACAARQHACRGLVAGAYCVWCLGYLSGRIACAPAVAVVYPA